MTGIFFSRNWLALLFGIFFTFRSSGQSEIMTAPFEEDWTRGNYTDLQGWLIESSSYGRIAIQPGDGFTALENHGGSNYTGNNRFRGNTYRADSDDVLLGHELYLGRSAPAQINFYVYRSTTQGGTYTLVSSVTRYLPEGSGFVSSGAINVPLTAGFYYVIGAALVDNATYYQSSGVSFPQSYGNITALTSATANSLPAPTSVFTTSGTIPYSQRLRLAGDSDEIPASSSNHYIGGAMHGNIYKVDDYGQRLNGHGMYLGRVTGPEEIEFAVYESTTHTGTYTRIDFQSVTAAAGTNFVSVSTDIPLTKNNYYILTATYAGNIDRFGQGSYFGPSSTTDLGPVTAVEGFYKTYTTSPETVSETVVSTNATCYRQQLWVDSKPALRMDHSGSTSLYSTNAASIRVEAEGYDHLYLDFKHRESSDEPHNADGVFLSDGVSETRLDPLSDTDDWTGYSFDLIDEAVSAGLSTSSSLYIHFQQTDNYPWTSDGREFTDIRIYSDPDLRWEEFDTGASSYLFRGFSSTKTIPIEGIIGLKGGLNSSSGSRLVRRQLLDSYGSVYSTAHYVTIDIPPMGHEELDYSSAIVVLPSIMLTQTVYYAKSILDISNTLTEGREDNNEGTAEVHINHYSGTLYFDDIETDIQVTDWDYQSGSAGSPVYHQITGSGTVEGYSFSFTDMLVEKDLSTLDYHISAAELRDFTVNGTQDTTSTVSNVRFTFLNDAVLNKDGGSGYIHVILPAGCGFINDTDLPYASSEIKYLTVELGEGLLPVGNYTGTPPEDFFFEESKPLIFEISEYTWLSEKGIFEFPIASVLYAHEKHLNTLEGLASLSPEQKIRRSNDGFYRYAGKIPGSKVEIRADSGGSAMASFQVYIGAGQMTAHLPYDSEITWTHDGLLTVQDDIVDADPAQSYLSGVDGVQVSYLGSCPGNCGGVTDIINVFCDISTEKLMFTSDGGLFGECEFTNGVEHLSWGALQAGKTYAQQAFGFTSGIFHMPGHFVDWDDDLPPTLNEIDAPAAILFTGVRSTGRDLVRPMTENYTDGAGSYGGLTVEYESGCRGNSILGASFSFDYDLYSGCKYYVRNSGVTGIHVADASLGTVYAEIYGYPFSFNTYALGYLSSENIESATEGSTSVPQPTNMDIDFEELLLTCLGDLDEAQPAESSSELMMEYWASRIYPTHIKFVPTQGCTPGSSVLALNISTQADNIPSMLFGTIGILNDGNLVAEDDNVPDVNSRLSLPTNLEIDGPNGEIYNLSTVSMAYFNDYREADGLTGMGAGLLTFAGELDVPFFENMLVQVFTSGSDGGTSPLTITGGWPDSGWTEGGDTYFSDISFDSINAGHPPELDFEEYLACSDTDYIPFAKRDWLGPIGFGIHVAWDSSSLSFRAPQPVEHDFFILSTEYNVPQMTAEHCEITFGLQYGDLPSLNLSSIFLNAVNETTGVANEFGDVVGDAITGAIEEGIDKVEESLDADPVAMLENAIGDQLDPLIDDLYNALSNNYASGSGYITNAINTYIRGTGGAYANDLNELLQKIVDGSGEAAGVASDLQSILDKAITTIDALTTGIEADPEDPLSTAADGLLSMVGNDYPLLETLGRVLMIFAVPTIDEADNKLEDAFDSVMQKLEPTLQSVNTTLLETKTELEEIRDQLDVVGEFHEELTDAIDSLAIDTLADDIADQLEGHLAELEGTFSPYANYTADEIKEIIRDTIFDALRQSEPVQDIKSIVRARMLDIDRRIRSGIDSILSQVTWAMQDVLSDVVGELDTSINGMIGDLNENIGTGNIDGYAEIYGDSLDLLRLDAELQMKVPDEMEFKGYIEIVNEQSSGDSGCAFASGDTYKVTVGAEDVNCAWLGSDTTLDVYCFVTLNDSIPKGFGGGLEMNGKIDFEGVVIEEFGAAVAFGALENYLSAATRLTSGSVEIEGGLFFGRTCTITPLEIVDENAGEVLGEPPFTGAYLYGEGWMPIYDYGCLFRIKAGAGLGVFYFLEGPTYGVRIMLGASGEALCVVSVKGEVELYGLKQGDSYKAQGTGKISGKAGSCPFCVKFKKSVKFTYEDGDWDADY